MYYDLAQKRFTCPLVKLPFNDRVTRINKLIMTEKMFDLFSFFLSYRKSSIKPPGVLIYFKLI